MALYFDRLSFMADDIVKQKNKIKKNNTMNNFREGIALDQQFTNELFEGNDKKLISLLYFDMYKLFYKSHADIEAIPPYGDDYPEFVDLAVLEEVGDLNINGWVTKRHYDKNVSKGHQKNDNGSIYYGFFGINYIDEFMRNISKSCTFEENLLIIKVCIDRNIYDVFVMADDTDELKYSVYFENNNEQNLLFVSKSSTLEADVENYVRNGGNVEVRTLFPEVYKKTYFQDYSGYVRTR